MARTIRNSVTIAITILIAAVSAISIGNAQPTGCPSNDCLIRVRGTVGGVDGNVLTVESRDGSQLKLKLKDDATVRAVVPAVLTDIKDGTNVGITSVPQADGSLAALEVHIFPAGQNVNQAHFGWDLLPNTFMTNGPVQTLATTVDGQVLTVQYKSGDKVEQKRIKVTSKTTIVSYEPATKAELKPGMKVFVAGAPKRGDGTLDVGTISFGKDGITPPM